MHIAPSSSRSFFGGRWADDLSAGGSTDLIRAPPADQSKLTKLAAQDAEREFRLHDPERRFNFRDPRSNVWPVGRRRTSNPPSPVLRLREDERTRVSQASSAHA